MAKLKAESEGGRTKVRVNDIGGEIGVHPILRGRVRVELLVLGVATNAVISADDAERIAGQLTRAAAVAKGGA